MLFTGWMIRLSLLISLCGSTFSQAWSHCYDAGGETACYYWEISGMCQSLGYRNYMNQICRRTCNLCPSIYIRPYSIPTKRAPVYKACRDARTRCASWKNFCSEGNQYYTFMQKHCPRTCAVCADPLCKDLNKKCQQYKANTYCHPDHKYFGYMKRNCQKSCQFCVTSENEIFTTPKPTDPAPVNKEFACDFETDECDWTNQFFEDTGDWAVGIDENGPKYGYKNSSQYLYVDNKHHGYKTKLLLPWQLTLPDGLTSKGVMCFTFMYQISHGRLTVLETENVRMNLKQPNPDKLFENPKYKLEWTRAKMNVRADSNYNLKLVAQTGSKNSYIVVDDFYFTDGKCN